MIVRELSGHSGCKLHLCKTADTIYVRKSTDCPNYNSRLKKQCLKQMKFSSINVFTPEVLKRGYCDGRFYFDMQFIQGRTLAQFAPEIPILDIADLVRLLFDTSYCQQSSASPDSTNVFLNKIDQLEACTHWNPTAQDALCILRDFNWEHVYRSPCHGDLTLENILVTPQKTVYLIDFLDSFYDSWMIDMAKLLQDLELGWAFRDQQPDVTRDFRMLVAKEALIEEIEKLPNHEEILQTIYHLLLLNVLRIYPYARDDSTIRFLNHAIQKVTDMLQMEFTGAI